MVDFKSTESLMFYNTLEIIWQLKKYFLNILVLLAVFGFLITLFGFNNIYNRECAIRESLSGKQIRSFLFAKFNRYIDGIPGENIAKYCWNPELLDLLVTRTTMFKLVLMLTSNLVIFLIAQFT